MKAKTLKLRENKPETDRYESPEWTRILLNLIYLNQKNKEVKVNDR